jgi:GTPase
MSTAKATKAAKPASPASASIRAAVGKPVPAVKTKSAVAAKPVAAKTVGKSTPAVKSKPASQNEDASKSIANYVSGTSEKDQNDLESMIQGMLKEPKLAAPPSTPVEGQRCGLIAIVGKPNVGKSTLLNALVGQKISITSRKAQTTRHRITGTHTVGATQFVFVDTPGFQTRHNNALNRALNKTVKGAVGDVDLILFVVEAGMFNQADAKVLSLIGGDGDAAIPTLLLANKLDQVTRRADIAPWLQDMQQRHKFAEFVPMSAKNTKDIERLLGICEKYLPEQPWRYAEDELTDRSEKFLASETVREKLFRLTGDELPYTSTVVIDKFEEEPGRGKGKDGTKTKRMVRIAATIVVERDTHKAMVIGDKGERIKRIGTETRVELEKLMDAKVFIEMWVKVRSGWADDEARVRSFGYE